MNREEIKIWANEQREIIRQQKERENRKIQKFLENDNERKHTITSEIGDIIQRYWEVESIIKDHQLGIEICVNNLNRLRIQNQRRKLGIFEKRDLEENSIRLNQKEEELKVLIPEKESLFELITSNGYTYLQPGEKFNGYTLFYGKFIKNEEDIDPDIILEEYN